MNRKMGFTLAEILITLLVIGVIASLTIPALMHNIQEAELKTAWKKAYSVLRQANLKLILDNNGTLKPNSYNADSLRDAFLTYLSYVKKCNAGTTIDNCWVSKDMASPSGTVMWSKTLLINAWGDPATAVSSAVLNDGMSIFFQNMDNNCNDITWSGQLKVCATVVVDVNGSKAPNVVGRDIFFMWLTANNLYPYGSSGDGKNCDSEDWSGCPAVYLYQ